MTALVGTPPDKGLRVKPSLLMVTVGLAVVLVGYWVALGTQSPVPGLRPLFVSGILLGGLCAGALASVVRSRRVGVACGALVATWAAIWGVLGTFSMGLPLLIIAGASLYLTARAADGVDGHPSRRWAVGALALTGSAGVALTVVCLVAT